MYQLKKRPLFRDELQLVDENGAAKQTITVVIDPDAMLARYNAGMLALREAQEVLNAADEKTLENYGAAVMGLLRVIFGDNADVILSHYDGRYLAMLDEVMPYIQDVIAPKLREASRRRLEKLKADRRG